MNPPYIYPDYKSSLLRGPTRAPLCLPVASTETGPQLALERVPADDGDLTANARVNGEPLGERIIVSGRLLDDRGRPVRRSVIELWQANAAGRYIHKVDQHDAPIDENFIGAGTCVTDDEGQYRFVTIKPGAYPWGNHHNAWRPAHLHFSVFGPAFSGRLITQMYFPGDPLMAFDPIFNSVPDTAARQRMVADFSLDLSEPGVALGYQFDLVVGGSAATPLDPD